MIPAILPRMQCLNYFSLTLWSLGYPEQARQRSLEACRLAEEWRHVPTLSQTLHYTANVHLRRREATVTFERSEQLIALSSKHGFAHFLAFGIGYQGRALVMQGQIEKGIAALQHSLDKFRQLKLTLPQITFTLLLIDAYRETEQIEQGWQAITKAKALIAEVGHHHNESELSRLEGELWMAPTNIQKSFAEAEKHLLHALNISRLQQTKSWELRAATSLARLWKFQSKDREAYDLLAPVYEWFTEGFDTADLIDAKALLDELS